MQRATRRSSGEHAAASRQTLASLQQIIAVTQDTARSVQEQAVVSDEIARNMDAVQKIAQEVLGSSEEAVVQGEQLHALALKLEELVRGFRLDGATRGNGARPARRGDARRAGAARAVERAAQDGARLSASDARACTERERSVRERLRRCSRGYAGLEPPAWALEARVRERAAALGARERPTMSCARGGATPASSARLVELLRVGETRFFRHRAAAATRWRSACCRRCASPVRGVERGLRHRRGGVDAGDPARRARPARSR